MVNNAFYKRTAGCWYLSDYLCGRTAHTRRQAALCKKCIYVLYIQYSTCTVFIYFLSNHHATYKEQQVAK